MMKSSLSFSLKRLVAKKDSPLIKFFPTDYSEEQIVFHSYIDKVSEIACTVFLSAKCGESHHSKTYSTYPCGLRTQNMTVAYTNVCLNVRLSVLLYNLNT